MTAGIPDGWHSVTPRIIVDDVPKLVAFLKHVFGATGEVHEDRPAVIRIGDSLVMISETGPRDTVTAFLYVYVPDVDATHQRAIQAGADRFLAKPVSPDALLDAIRDSLRALIRKKSD